MRSVLYHNRAVVAGFTVMLGACTPSVGNDPTLTESLAPRAVFAPGAPCESVVPTPNDLARAGGHVVVPVCPSDDADAAALKTGLATLDGFSLGGAAMAPISREIDPATLAAFDPTTGRGSFALFNTTTGQPVPATATLLPKGVAFETPAVSIVPIHPLAERTRYLAILTTDIADANGVRLASDAIFTFVKSRDALVDADGKSRYAATLGDADAAALEPLRLGMAPALDMVSTIGLTRSRVAVAWAFTTQSVVSQLAAVANSLTPATLESFDTSFPAEDHPFIQAAGIPSDHLCQVALGHLRVKSLLTPQGVFSPTLEATEVTVPYLMTTPVVGGECGAFTGGKVAIFAHGLGRCANDALALANSLGAAGFATVAIDAPGSGERMSTSVDADRDGCYDAGAVPELLGPAGGGMNPFYARDHLREWAIEIAQVAMAMRTSAPAFAGEEGATTTSHVVVVGHSFGGIAASWAGLMGEVEAVIANGASAELGAVFTPSLGEVVKAKLIGKGVDVTTPAGQAMLAVETSKLASIFRWILESADPLYAASIVPGKKALVQRAAAPAGAEAPLHASATQEMFAMAYGAAVSASRFDLSLEGAALCDTPVGAVGALLKPCVADVASPRGQAALAATAGMQRQVAVFAATALGGEGTTPVVCPQDLATACP